MTPKHSTFSSSNWMVDHNSRLLPIRRSSVCSAAVTNMPTFDRPEQKRGLPDQRLGCDERTRCPEHRQSAPAPIDTRHCHHWDDTKTFLVCLAAVTYHSRYIQMSIFSSSTRRIIQDACLLYTIGLAMSLSVASRLTFWVTGSNDRDRLHK